MRIERAVSDGELQQTTKTGGRRVVDLTDRLTERLRVRLACARQDAEAAGEEWSGEALVFGNRVGGLADHPNVVRRFRALLEKAGLPMFRLYDLRHSYASHLLLSGAPVTYVANQLGHAKPTMTLSTYSHWMPSANGRRFIQAMEQLRG